MNTLLAPFRLITKLLPGHRVDPARDWALLLWGTALALILIVLWNVWAFETVVGGGTLGNIHVDTTAPPNTSALDTVATLIDERAAEDAKYLGGTYRFADPSQ